jgi:hypothetical protein
LLVDANVPGLYAVGIFTNVLPGTAAKFIIKCSLFLQKFKGAGQAETEEWLCFWLMFIGQAPIA